MKINHKTARFLHFVFLSLLLLLFSCAEHNELSQKECEKTVKEAILISGKNDFGKAVTLLTEVKDVAYKNGWHDVYFDAVNNLGRCYNQMGNYEEALHLLLNLQEYAQKYLDKSYELKIINNIAVIYSEEQQYDVAEQQFLKIYHYAKAESDSLLWGATAINIAKILELRQDKRSLEYIDTALSVLPKKESSYQLLARQTKLPILITFGRYEEAKELDALLTEEMKQYTENEEIGNLLFCKSQIALADGHYKEAASYANQAMNRANLDMKKQLCLHLSDVFSRSGDMKKAFDYRDSALVIADSIYMKKSKLLFENSRIKAELVNAQSRLSESQITIKFERLLFSTLGVLIAAIVWVLRLQLMRNKEKRRLAEQQRKIVELELEDSLNKKIILEKQLKEEEMRSEMEKNQLYEKIETKNRELTAKALHLSSRNELVKETLDFLSSIDEIKDRKEYNQYILKLKSQLRSDVEMENFLSYFEEVNSTFMANLRLKHPNLNANDMRFIAYTYMGLNTKEIASLLNITIDACKKRKQRICAKMGLEDTSLLYSYLLAI